LTQGLMTIHKQWLHNINPLIYYVIKNNYLQYYQTERQKR